MSFPAYVPSGSASAPAGAPAATPTRAPPAGLPRAATGAGADDPALPVAPETYDENELRSAVGASPVLPDERRAAASRDAEPDDHLDDEDQAPRRRVNPRTLLLAALIAAGAAGVAALVLLGHVNSQRFVLACEPARAVPEQGRGFPPWGTRALAGEAWRPLKIAPETRCQPQETDDPLVLERAFLAMVLDQVTALLTAREVTRVDDAEALLKQALLLTRPPEHESEPLARQRTEQHQQIERLLGDVAYWRAAARVRDAAAALGDAAKQYDAAVAQHPRHVSDAGAWAAHVRKLAQQLLAGPAGPPAPAGSPPAPAGSTTVAPTPERPSPPAGVALPVEPSPASPAPAPAAPPPDAGTPTGGVLL